MLSCGGQWPPAAPTAAASCSASAQGCVPASPAVVFAVPHSEELAAPSAQPGTSLPAAHGLQSDMGPRVSHIKVHENPFFFFHSPLCHQNS